jgi:hypothetical protein
VPAGSAYELTSALGMGAVRCSRARFSEQGRGRPTICPGSASRGASRPSRCRPVITQHDGFDQGRPRESSASMTAPACSTNGPRRLPGGSPPRTPPSGSAFASSPPTTGPSPNGLRPPVQQQADIARELGVTRQAIQKMLACRQHRAPAPPGTRPDRRKGELHDEAQGRRLRCWLRDGRDLAAGLHPGARAPRAGDHQPACTATRSGSAPGTPDGSPPRPRPLSARAWKYGSARNCGTSPPTRRCATSRARPQPPRNCARSGRDSSRRIPAIRECGVVGFPCRVNVVHCRAGVPVADRRPGRAGARGGVR